MAQWKFTGKAEIKMPKVEGKKNTPKMKQAVNKALSKGAQKGSTYVESSLKAALNNSIESNIWGPFSPKVPYISRGGNSRGSGSRSNVDTGALRDSLKIDTKFSQTKVSFSVVYKSPYAAFVHYGGIIKPYGNRNAADVIIPARPWVQAVFEGTHNQPKFDIRTPFDKGIKEAWSAQFGT